MYDLTLKRFAYPIEWRDEVRGEILHDTRRAHDWVASHTDPSAIVQPGNGYIFMMHHQIYAQRLAFATPNRYNPRIHGPSSEHWHSVTFDIRRMFADTAKVSDAAEVCRRYGIDYVIVTGFDDVWKADSTWVHRVPAEFRAEHAAVFSADRIVEASR